MVPDPGAVARATAEQTGLAVVAVDREKGAAHLRMFGPQVGVTEDPATGSAAVALGVLLAPRAGAPRGSVGALDRAGCRARAALDLDVQVDVAGGAAAELAVRGGVRMVAKGELLALPGDDAAPVGRYQSPGHRAGGGVPASSHPPPPPTLPTRSPPVTVPHRPPVPAGPASRCRGPARSSSTRRRTCRPTRSSSTSRTPARRWPSRAPARPSSRRSTRAAGPTRLRVVRVNDWTTEWTYRDVTEVVEGAGPNLDCDHAAEGAERRSRSSHWTCC